MKVTINLANKDSSIEQLKLFKDKKYAPFYLNIINSHIKELNKVVGRNIFKKDAVYINSLTLWEIMQPVGGQGSHHYHGLTPDEVYGALSKMQYSKNVIPTYDDRYVVITDVVVNEYLKLIVIISSETDIISEDLKNIVAIITIYPSDK